MRTTALSTRKGLQETIWRRFVRLGAALRGIVQRIARFFLQACQRNRATIVEQRETSGAQDFNFSSYRTLPIAHTNSNLQAELLSSEGRRNTAPNVHLDV